MVLRRGRSGGRQSGVGDRRLPAAHGVGGHRRVADAVSRTVAVTLMGVLLVGGVGLPLTAKVVEDWFLKKLLAKAASNRVTELGKALDRLGFDPGADGVTPDMRRHHAQALDAYRAARRDSCRAQ